MGQSNSLITQFRGTRSVAVLMAESRCSHITINAQYARYLPKGQFRDAGAYPLCAPSADVSSVTKKLGGWVVQTLSASTLVRTAACGSDCNVDVGSDQWVAGWAQLRHRLGTRWWHDIVLICHVAILAQAGGPIFCPPSTNPKLVNLCSFRARGCTRQCHNYPGHIVNSVVCMYQLFKEEQSANPASL